MTSQGKTLTRGVSSDQRESAEVQLLHPNSVKTPEMVLEETPIPRGVSDYTVSDAGESQPNGRPFPEMTYQHGGRPDKGAIVNASKEPGGWNWDSEMNKHSGNEALILPAANDGSGQRNQPQQLTRGDFVVFGENVDREPFVPAQRGRNVRTVGSKDYTLDDSEAGISNDIVIPIISKTVSSSEPAELDPSESPLLAMQSSTHAQHGSVRITHSQVTCEAYAQTVKKPQWSRKSVRLILVTLLVLLVAAVVVIVYLVSTRPDGSSSTSTPGPRPVLAAVKDSFVPAKAQPTHPVIVLCVEDYREDCTHPPDVYKYNCTLEHSNSPKTLEHEAKSCLEQRGMHGEFDYRRACRLCYPPEVSECQKMIERPYNVHRLQC